MGGGSGSFPAWQCAACYLSPVAAGRDAAACTLCWAHPEAGAWSLPNSARAPLPSADLGLFGNHLPHPQNHGPLSSTSPSKSPALRVAGSPEPQSRRGPHGQEGFLCCEIDSGFDLMGQLLGSPFNKSDSGEREGQSSPQCNVPPGHCVNTTHA